jgi:hypothetical protein
MKKSILLHRQPVEHTQKKRPHKILYRPSPLMKLLLMIMDDIFLYIEYRYVATSIQINVGVFELFITATKKKKMLICSIIMKEI